MKRKKGLSGIVTTLIIIALSIVAVGIIWYVVNNVLSTSQTKISLDRSYVTMQIKEVRILGENKVEVDIQRSLGGGTISGVKLVFSNGSISESINKESIGPGSNKNFEINLTNFSALNLQSVNIYPLLNVSGKESLGIKGSYEISEENKPFFLSDNNLVSWWRLEGNAVDETGFNNGTINGVDCNVEGKVGLGCEFRGEEDDIQMSTPMSTSGGISVSAWIKRKGSYDTGLGTIYLLGSQSIQGFHWIYVAPGNAIYWQYSNGTNSKSIGGSFNYPIGEWTHLVITHDYSAKRLVIYRNGVSVKESSSGAVNPVSLRTSKIGEYGSTSHHFNGTIDEVMVFNRSISADEAKKIYEFGVS